MTPEPRARAPTYIDWLFALVGSRVRDLVLMDRMAWRATKVLMCVGLFFPPLPSEATVRSYPFVALGARARG